MARVRWDHLQVFSRQPDEMADWLARHFGAEVRPGPGRIEVILAGVTLFVARGAEGLLAGPQHPHAGFDHIGLGVEDIEGFVATLAAAGVRITQGVTQLRPGVKAAFIEGPERLSIELLQRD